jgi:hypothetical protein
MEVAGVVPGVSYSGEFALGVLPSEDRLVSVGDAALLALFLGAMTGIDTSFKARVRFLACARTISSLDDSSSSGFDIEGADFRGLPRPLILLDLDAETWFAAAGKEKD